MLFYIVWIQKTTAYTQPAVYKAFYHSCNVLGL